MKAVVLTEYLQVGDRVAFCMDAERRSYAPKGVPENGTLGTVVGFYRYKDYRGLAGHGLRNEAPGVYEARGAAYVDFDDGFRLRTGSGHDLAFADPAVDRTRHEERTAYEATHGLGSWIEMRRDRIWIADLPASKFYPGDVVRPVLGNADHEVASWEITEVQYHWSDQRAAHHHDQICYQVNAFDEEGRSMFGSTYWDNDLRLVRRGPIWAHYANEAFAFETLEHEANTAHWLGKSAEMRNPATGNFAWTESEWKDALQNGEVDAVRVDRNLAMMLQTTPKVCVYRFDDRGLGERVRKETLQGFGLEDRLAA